MRKIVLGITGASGAIYAKLLIEKLQAMKTVKLAIVFSNCGEQVFRHELGDDAFSKISALRYSNDNFFAPFASGSGDYDTMIVAPCSVGALARIAQGISNDLLTRAADVMLKERRKLILVPRETPLNLIHVRNMQQIIEAGGIICPANPSFYSLPKTIEEATTTVVDRVLQLGDLENNGFHWGEE